MIILIKHREIKIFEFSFILFVFIVVFKYLKLSLFFKILWTLLFDTFLPVSLKYFDDIFLQEIQSLFIFVSNKFFMYNVNSSSLVLKSLNKFILSYINLFIEI